MVDLSAEEPHVQETKETEAMQKGLKLMLQERSRQRLVFWKQQRKVPELQKQQRKEPDQRLQHEKLRN